MAALQRWYTVRCSTEAYVAACHSKAPPLILAPPVAHARSGPWHIAVALRPRQLTGAHHGRCKSSRKCRAVGHLARMPMTCPAPCCFNSGWRGAGRRGAVSSLSTHEVHSVFPIYIRMAWRWAMWSCRPGRAAPRTPLCGCSARRWSATMCRSACTSGLTSSSGGRRLLCTRLCQVHGHAAVAWPKHWQLVQAPSSRLPWWHPDPVKMQLWYRGLCSTRYKPELRTTAELQ
jgi:hypothetical protein